MSADPWRTLDAQRDQARALERFCAGHAWELAPALGICWRAQKRIGGAIRIVSARTPEALRLLVVSECNCRVCGARDRQGVPR